MPSLSFSFEKHPQDETTIQRTFQTRSGLHTELENKLGLRYVTELMPDEYKFSRMGGWSVAIRASIVRVVTFKMVGTGLAAFAMAISSKTGRYTASSCALCSAVNLIAAVHYAIIWMIRSQNLPTGFNNWRATVGRAPEPEEKGRLLATRYRSEVDRDKVVIFAQENAVDMLRFSDWTCTLVIMSLDLGNLRDWLLDVERERAGTMPIPKEWVAAMQPIMVLFGSVFRFYCNELRGSPSRVTVIVGLFCFAISVGFFVAINFGLLGNALAPWKFNAKVNGRDIGLETDAWALRTFVIVWSGYPIVALLQCLFLRGTPEDEYSANVSLFKDVSYGILDVVSKAGMAIYFTMKARWMDTDLEFAALCGGSAVGCRPEDIVPL